MIADTSYGQTVAKNHFLRLEQLILLLKPNGRPYMTSMRRFLSSLFLILPIFLFTLGEAGATLIDTVIVPANGTNVQSKPLTAGTYDVLSSEFFALDPGHFTDTVLFSTSSNFQNIVSDPSYNNVYLVINGQRAVFTDATNSTSQYFHEYHTSLTTNGGPAIFSIHDCASCYANNTGYLKVDISTPAGVGGVNPVGSSLFSWSVQAATVPEPGSLGLLGAGIIGLGLKMRRRRGV